jgi:hypothetical protein
MEKRMRKFISSLLAILVVTNIEAQQQIPKLVVCITVDQLRGDYIEYFYNTFGERGFKRILNEGLVYKNIRFEFSNINEASAFATIFTGSNPRFHGISSLKQYDFDNNRETSVLYDANFLGNFTKDHFSPKALLSSTIGDELKIASGGRSDVYTIAPQPEEAILSAGHAANCAFWLDDINGKWATTTFYKDVPWYVDHYNNGNDALPTRVGKMTWTPLLSNYKAFPYTVEQTTFRYTFADKAKDCYPRLKTSPFINDEVNKLALNFLEYAAFGSRSCPDMLALTYYAGNYSATGNQEYSKEIQDTYYKLDKNLESLFDAIDKKVGLKNTLIVFTGTGYYNSEETIPASMNIINGEFHPKRCVALLNMYLMAIYGQKSNWVTGYYDNQIYLNRKAIDDAKLSIDEVENKAASFLREFSGIQLVTTNHELLTSEWNETTAGLSKGTHHLRRGNLIIDLLPGWTINYDNNQQVRTVRNNAVLTPLVFMGNGLKPRHIYREVKATEIAPTIAHVLRIRPPNASDSTPLEEFYGMEVSPSK